MMRIDASSHYNLAVLLMRTPGRMTEAFDEVEKARKLNPSSQSIHNLAVQLGDVE